MAKERLNLNMILGNKWSRSVVLVEVPLLVLMWLWWVCGRMRDRGDFVCQMRDFSVRICNIAQRIVQTVNSRTDIPEHDFYGQPHVTRLLNPQ